MEAFRGIPPKMREKDEELFCGLVSVHIHPLYMFKWIERCMIQSILIISSVSFLFPDRPTPPDFF